MTRSCYNVSSRSEDFFFSEFFPEEDSAGCGFRTVCGVQRIIYNRVRNYGGSQITSVAGHGVLRARDKPEARNVYFVPQRAYPRLLTPPYTYVRYVYLHTGTSLYILRLTSSSPGHWSKLARKPPAQRVGIILLLLLLTVGRYTISRVFGLAVCTALKRVLRVSRIIIIIIIA